MRRTLRQIKLEGWGSGGPPPDFHWPGGKEEAEGLWRLDERAKCQHCQNVHDGISNTLGDLEWDEEQGQWICGTPGCDAVLREDWLAERQQQVYSKPVKG